MGRKPTRTAPGCQQGSTGVGLQLSGPLIGVGRYDLPGDRGGEDRPSERAKNRGGYSPSAAMLKCDGFLRPRYTANCHRRPSKLLSRLLFWKRKAHRIEWKVAGDLLLWKNDGAKTTKLSGHGCRGVRWGIDRRRGSGRRNWRASGPAARKVPETMPESGRTRCGPTNTATTTGHNARAGRHGCGGCLRPTTPTNWKRSCTRSAESEWSGVVRVLPLLLRGQQRRGLLHDPNVDRLQVFGPRQTNDEDGIGHDRPNLRLHLFPQQACRGNP